MINEKELILQRDIYARQLKDKAEMLKFVCERLIETLEKENLTHINELGEIQTLGSDVDVLCAKVSVLSRVANEYTVPKASKDGMKDLWVKQANKTIK